MGNFQSLGNVGQEVLKDKILERPKQEHDSKVFSHQYLILYR